MNEQQILQQLNELVQQLVSLNSADDITDEAVGLLPIQDSIFTVFDSKNLAQYSQEFLTDALDPSNVVLPAGFVLDPTRFQDYREEAGFIDEENESLVQYVRIEPFTAAWVAAYIAAGILTWIGSKIMDSLFGGGKLDFEQFMRDIVRALTLIVKQALEEDALREYTADLEALETSISQYQNAKTEGRLDVATSKALALIPRVKSLKLLGYNAFFIAAGLQIANLQDRVLFFGKDTAVGKGEKRNIVLAIDKALDAVKNYNTLWKKWNESRFVLSFGKEQVYYPGTEIYPSGPFPIPGKYAYSYRITKDNSNIASADLGVHDNDPLEELETIKKYFKKLINEEFIKVREEYIDPFKPITKQWKKLRDEID